MTRLADVDLSLSLKRTVYERRLAVAQTRLAQLRLTLGGQIGLRSIADDVPRPDHSPHPLGPPLLIAFEGWDASGKGGAIKRLVQELDPRHYEVHQFSAPSPDELRHHWLHRFWVPLPGRGGMCVYDRTWYGRVLVERIEGLADEEQWRRAYGEIREFEQQLVDDGTMLVKIWLHVSDEEQLRRFERRRGDPLKAWKLTDEDWRNRARRPEYERAIDEMLAETDTPHAPWDVVAAESKKWARVAVIETVVARIEQCARDRGFDVPAPLE
ncbi:MAG: polyphosphate kinase 2 family protein [Solirubrobacteraceae bacterium]